MGGQQRTTRVSSVVGTRLIMKSKTIETRLSELVSFILHQYGWQTGPGGPLGIDVGGDSRRDRWYGTIFHDQQRSGRISRSKQLVNVQVTSVPRSKTELVHRRLPPFT